MERAIFAAGSCERVEETFRRIESVQQTIGNDQMGPVSTAPRFSSIRLNRKLRHTPRKSGCDSARFTRPIVTELVPATRFYRPEKYRRPHIARQGDAVSRG